MTGRRRRTRWVVALSAAFLVTATVPAGAHDHPTPTERAAPGVVYVEAGAEVEVSLVEHLQTDPEGVHIRIVQSTSNPVLASASGFVVDPTGAIVTSGSITQTDLELARIYAINRAFADRYPDRAPLPADPFTRQQVGDPTDRLQQRLEACYPPHTTNDAGGCVVRVTPTYVVYPYVTSQAEYGQLPAELLGASTPEVGVLRVRGASGMPTVAVGESTEGALALAVLGFTGIPAAQDSLQAINSHLAESGGTVLKSQDLTEAEAEAAVALAPAVRNGLRGGPVVAEKGQVIGFIEPEADSGPPPATAGRLVDIGTIAQVLSAAGVTPRRGPVDTSFEAASHAFKNGGFAAAIPNLEKTLELFPGHAMADANLAEAQQQVTAGRPGAPPPASGNSATAASGSDFPWTAVLSSVAVLLLLTAGALLVLRRRRQASPTGGPARGAAGGAPPLSVSPRPREGKPGEAKPGDGKPGGGKPAATSRAATGQRERQKVPGATVGSKPGAVSVIESAGPRLGGAASPRGGEPAFPGGAPSTSLPGQRSAEAAGAAPRGASRVSAGPAVASPSESHPSSAPASDDRPSFCTSCGANLAAHYRYCAHCGAAAG